MTRLEKAVTGLAQSFSQLRPEIRQQINSLTDLERRVRTIQELTPPQTRTCSRCGMKQSEMCVGDLEHEWLPDPEDDDEESVSGGGRDAEEDTLQVTSETVSEVETPHDPAGDTE